MRRRKLFGIDLFEVVIQFVVTCAVAGAASNLPSRPADILVPMVFVASLLFLAWRRRQALRADPDTDIGGERVEDLEYRVAELEHSQQRVLELEERLDFAERMLARQRVHESLPEER
ncbi:MAG: hypothetical protein ABI836_02930 [Gemmatimonadota bacterium]